MKSTVACTCEDRGCEWKGDLSLLHSHLENDCDCNPVTCPHCLLKVSWKLYNAHAKMCPMIPEICPFAEIGCTVSGLTRKSLETHIATDAHSHSLSA